MGGFVVDDELPLLPAVVEVAAYRIVMEALTNVARHCDSSTATVTLEAMPEECFVIEVVDAGAPVATWQPGVGITSMAERVSELGGTFSAGPGPHGGRVRAVLPLGV